MCLFILSLDLKTFSEDGGKVDYCQWDSVQFIGLFGLSVYLSMHFLTDQWNIDQFIG